MQTKSLPIKSYTSWPIADTASPQTIARLKKLQLYDPLKSEGGSIDLRTEAYS